MGHRQARGTGASAAPYLVVATSVRALAVSARRGGHTVCAADAFGDRDTRQAAWRLLRLPARGLELKADHLARRLERISEQIPFAGLVYGSGLEHCPQVLTALGRRLPILGNTARTLQESQDPRRLAHWLRGLDVSVPETSEQAPADPQGWLVKPGAGNGGVGVRLASAEAPAPGDYHQRLVPGETLSASFLADGHQARLLGIHQQFCADPAVTGSPFVHGGGVGRPDLMEHLGPRFQALADRLTRRAGLRGLNGVDCVLQGDRLWLLELNARPCASMDIYDPALPEGLFHWHLAAVRGEELPEPHADTECRGYRMVYAPRDLRVRADVRWPSWVSDRPAPRQIVPAGAPVCSITAQGPDHQRVGELLTRRAGEILDQHVDGRRSSWWPLCHRRETIFTTSSSRGITT